MNIGLNYETKWTHRQTIANCDARSKSKYDNAHDDWETNGRQKWLCKSLNYHVKDDTSVSICVVHCWGIDTILIQFY